MRDKVDRTNRPALFRPITGCTTPPGITRRRKATGVEAVDDPSQARERGILDGVPTEAHDFIVETIAIQAFRTDQVFPPCPGLQAQQFPLAIVDVQDAEKGTEG